MNRLDVSILGSVKFQLNEQDITDALRTRKERALLAYLAEEAPRIQARSSIAEVFWPDKAENYARMNLRQALLGMRRAIGDEETTREFLRINEDTVQFLKKQLWLDTRAFSEHIQAVKDDPHDHLHTCTVCMGHLEQAVELYRGDFMDDMLLGDVTGFQEWIVSRRERYYRSLLDVLKLLTKAFYKQSNYDQAYFYAWRYVDLAPLEEGAHRLLMRLLALSGRRSAALQQYEFCRVIIKREFGIEPSLETRQLYTYIKNGLPIEKIDTGSLPAGKAVNLPAQRTLPKTDELYDPDTHVPTRPLFMDRLRHALTRMERAQLMAIVCVISVTIHSAITLTAAVQKQVEQHLVRRLVGSVREGDTVARMQENEFALILEEIKDPAVTEKIIAKIDKAISTPIMVQGNAVRVQASFGTSIYPQDGVDPIALLNLADVAMRTARIQSP